MENERTVEVLAREINALTMKEKKFLLRQLNQSAAPHELPSANEKHIYPAPVDMQMSEPIILAEQGSKALPERYEPSHLDIDKIFGGFQTSKSAEELIEELYKLRTTGTERANLNE